MTRRTRTPKLHPLSRATAAVLIGLLVAPSLSANNSIAIDGDGQHEGTEVRSATADSVVSQGANAALDEVVSFVGDSKLPFLGSLQGGITYDHANGSLRYNLSTIGKLFGKDSGHHWLGQIGAHNEGDRDTVNLGLIYRWVDITQAWLIGGNLFYDRDFDTGAQRAGVGVEAATRQWRMFSNAYGGIANAWRDALVDGDTWEERVANGYDLGAAWSPGALPSLDLQLKASRWLGDAVDVFDNETLHRDPLVWSAKVGYSPIPLLSLNFEQERVVNGDTNNRIDLQVTYRFGQSLAEQLEPANLARRNDIAARALAPVERQHRIVMEQREKHRPLVFVGPSLIRLSLAADDVLAHALEVTGGVGAVVFSLEGRDAGRFRVVDGHLALAPDAATLESKAHALHVVPAQAAAEELQVTVLARDSRGREARQGFEITREQKQAPPEERAPTMEAPTIAGVVAIGETLTATLQGFNDPDGDAEGTHRFRWYRAADAAGARRVPIDDATTLQFTITEAEIGAWLVFEVVPVSLIDPFEGAAVHAVTSTAVEAMPEAPSMQAPTIAGVVAVGATLTGTPQGFSDPNGDAEGAHRFQWYRASDAGGTQRTAIDGATNLQYTITTADIGAWLVFEVTPVSAAEPFDGTDVSTVAASRVEEPPQVPTMQAPLINGAVAVGATLTGVPQDFHDINGDAEGAHRYQWYRASDAAGTQRTPIDGATGLQFTITTADIGAWLVFEVIPVSAVEPFDGIAASAIAASMVEEPPQAPTMQAPTINGTIAVGATLTGAPQGFHDINGDAEGAHRYQWYRAGDAAGTQRTPIDGATDLQFTITTADIGAWLVFEVTPVSAMEPFDGVAVGTVAPSRVEEPPQAPTMQAPTINGEVFVGSTLTGIPQGFDDINGDAEGAHRYQWYRATDASGTQRTAIADATGVQFTVTAADIGAWLVFEIVPVSLVAPHDGIAVRTVTATAATHSPQAPTMQSPTLSGHVGVGRTLTATPVGFNDINGDAPGAHAYRWYRASDAAGTNRVAIDGANAATHVLTNADIGSWLHFGVTPVSVGAPTHGDEVRTAAMRAVPAPTAPTMTPADIGSGDVAVGTRLVAVPTGYHDEDGDPQGTSIHRWYRASDAAGTNRTLIDGANTNTYDVVTTDLGHHIVAGVIPVSATGTPSLGIEVFTVSIASVAGAMTYANNNHLHIPDRPAFPNPNNEFVYSEIPVSGRAGNGPANASVDVSIEHPWGNGSIILILIAPDGSQYLLKDLGNVNSGPFGNKTYAVDLRGEALNGTWTLAVADGHYSQSGYTGHLNHWRITF